MMSFHFFHVMSGFCSGVLNLISTLVVNEGKLELGSNVAGFSSLLESFVHIRWFRCKIVQFWPTFELFISAVPIRVGDWWKPQMMMSQSHTDKPRKST